MNINLSIYKKLLICWQKINIPNLNNILKEEELITN